MRAVTRAACLALLLVALASVAAVQQGSPGRGFHGTSQAVPMASLNLSELFGDENEPDENEAEEGGAQGTSSQTHGSGVSIPVVALLVVLAGALGGYVYIRIRRLILRARAWGRDLWARL
jgi:hypothetical protein